MFHITNKTLVVFTIASIILVNFMNGRLGAGADTNICPVDSTNYDKIFVVRHNLY